MKRPVAKRYSQPPADEVAQQCLDLSIGIDCAKYRRFLAMYSADGLLGEKNPVAVALRHHVQHNPKYHPLRDALEREQQDKLVAMPAVGGVQ